MKGPNRARLILGITVAAAVALGALVQSFFPNDQSDKPFAATVMIGVLVGIAVMLAWQKGWFERSREAAIDEALGSDATVADLSPQRVTQLSPTQLMVALAVAPAGGRHRAATTAATWQIGAQSMHGGRVIFVLIAATMPAGILFAQLWLIFAGAAMIVGYALLMSFRLLSRGGTLDQIYELADDQLAELGLKVTERPELTVEPRLDVISSQGMRMTHRMRGPTVIEGRRHGHAVTVRLEDGSATTSVAAPSAEFDLSSSRRGKLHADAGAPAGITTSVAELPSSPRWASVSAHGGSGGIEVSRSNGSEQTWIYDLWLAERLGDAARTA